MQINESIINSMLYQWQSPDVDKYERARFLANYLLESKLTHIQFCDKFKVPKSTLEGWLVYRKLTPLQFQECVKAGCSETHIHNSLKSMTKQGSAAVAEIVMTHDKFGDSIEKCIRILKPFTRNPPHPENGELLRLVELRDTILRLIKDMEKR
jgi:hypothetical protein